MAKPSKKSPAMNEFLSRVMGRDRVSTIKGNKCMTCGKDADKFDDELSRKEYAISGMCQSCQNLAYGPGEEKALVEPEYWAVCWSDTKEECGVALTETDAYGLIKDLVARGGTTEKDYIVVPK